ncbi:hypothetical protein L1887_20315 [Cichorium endivia]|nr:hypothetical protein L1887_20315 [Cichorium endivia]
MGEVSESVTIDDYEVVIIGAGICGLATAVALHKKGIKSIVMERSETLRSITGAAIGIRQNGWRALDQLGVADVLRGTAIPIQRERFVGLDGGKLQEMSMLSLVAKEASQSLQISLTSKLQRCFPYVVLEVYQTTQMVILSTMSLLVFRKDNSLVGRIPIDNHLVYWFCGRPYVPIDERIWEDPEAIRRSTLELVTDYHLSPRN